MGGSSQPKVVRGTHTGRHEKGIIPSSADEVVPLSVNNGSRYLEDGVISNLTSVDQSFSMWIIDPSNEDTSTPGCRVIKDMVIKATEQYRTGSYTLGKSQTVWLEAANPNAMNYYMNIMEEV